MTQQGQQFPAYGQTQYRMGQQYPSYGQQPQMGQQYPSYGQQQSQMGQQFQAGQGQQFQSGQRGFAESVPNEVLGAVSNLDQLATVADWTHAQAMQRGNPVVATLCDDIQEIALLEKKLIIRQSQSAQSVGQAAVQSIQSSIQQLGQQTTEPGVQETVNAAQQAITSIQSALSRLQTFQGGMAQQQPQNLSVEFGQSVSGQGSQPYSPQIR